MKKTKFTFGHPVSGKALIESLEGKILRSINVNSNEDDDVVIPLKGIPAGLWRLIFEWEYNGRFYSINKDLKIS